MLVQTRSAAAMRWTARAPRIALIATAIVLSMAGLRAILEPTPTRTTPRAAVPQTADPESLAFARAYAREYLTWNAAHPDDYERRTARFATTELGPDAGARLPRRGRQSVADLSVRRALTTGSDTAAVVDAVTSTGTQSLSVVVSRSGARLAVTRPPALVASALTDKKRRTDREDLVEDTQLERIVARATTNYVAGQRDNLLADLETSANVATPDRRLAVQRTEDPTWVQRGRRVAIQTDVLDRRTGAVMALRYELAVVRRAGRWLVRAVQPIDPPVEGSP